MPLVVSLRGVVNEMDVFSDEHTAYINRKTGELITLTEEDRSLLEDEEPSEDLPEWQQEMIPKIRELLESDDFIELPSKFDIHEWSIMERFCSSVEDPDQREQLLNAIHGSGAFRYFKDTIHRLGIADPWYRFRDAALEEIAIDFLEANGIAFKRDSQPP